MHYVQQIIGKNIKKYRKINNLTLEKLAEKISINYQNLSKIERGKGFVTADTLEKLCEVLNVSAEQLFSLNNSLPEKINDEDDVKPLLHQIINDFDSKKSKALYKLVLAFIELKN